MTQRPITAVLSGLILGEQLSWTALYERSTLLPYWTRRKRREIEAQHDAEGILETTLPFALNQSPDPLYPGPGAHSEWFIFQLQLMQAGDRYLNEHTRAERTLAAWRTLSGEADTLRLSLAQAAALGNLKRGEIPPVSGSDNPHYFDDGACFRALATACILEDNADILDAVAYDASLTNAEDGRWAALALAAFIGAREAPLEIRLEQALGQLPPDSWIRTNADAALAHARASNSVFDIAARLSRHLANYTYSYSNAAADTVPAALAILAFTGTDLEKAMLAALAVPRLTGSLAPLVGALCGACSSTMPAGLLETPLAGVALPFLAGRSAAAYLSHDFLSTFLSTTAAGERTVHGSDT